MTITWEYCRIEWRTTAIDPKAEVNIRARGFRGEIRTVDDPVMGKPTTYAVIGELRFSRQGRDSVEEFTDLHGMITRLGLDGWDLVTVNAGEFWFKRLMAG